MFIKKKQSDEAHDIRDFKELVTKTYKRLYNAAWYFSGNHEDALDLVQETFARAFIASPGFKGESSFYTWIYAIFRNVRRNADRHKKLFVNRTGSIIASDQEDADIAAPDNPYTLIVESELYHSIHDALMTLPEKYREVLLLRHFEDFSYAEIARILECSQGTVKSRIFKARRLLRKKLR